MNRKKIMNKIITAAIVGGVLISTGTAAFAATNSDSNSTSTSTARHECRLGRGISTDRVKSELDKLITAGTITESQETSILSKVSEEQTEKKAEMDKIKNMTDSERQAYFQSQRNTEEGNFLSALVTDGTLTQAQADAVKSEMAQDNIGKGNRKDWGLSSEKMKTKLDALVTSGTITQDDETKIINYLTQKQNDRKAEMEKVKNMSKSDRKAYFESSKTTGRTDMLSDLVTSGIITQDKADAIKASMHAQKDHTQSQDTTNNQ